MSLIKRSMVAIVLLAAVVPIRAGGQTADDKLAALARFAGEWEVAGKWADGQTLQARGIYAWSLGKKIMTTKTMVRDGDKEYQRYEGVMAWHPEKKSLFQISFAFDGTITETIMESKDANTLHIGWVPFTPEKLSSVRQVIRFLDNDSFQWIVSVKDGEAWKQLIDATWKRKR